MFPTHAGVSYWGGGGLSKRVKELTDDCKTHQFIIGKTLYDFDDFCFIFYLPNVFI